MENYAQWCISVHNIVLAGSGVGYKAFDWISKCKKPHVSLGDLADSEGFSSLDFKLAGAISRIQTGTLGSTLTRYALEYASSGVPLKGRQMLLLVHQNYQTGLQTGQLYQPRHLLDVQLKGDSAMEAFLEQWVIVYSAVEAKLPQGFAHDAFLDQMEKSSALKGTLDYYHRLPPGHIDKSYEFLLQAATQVTTRKHQLQNRQALTKSLSNVPKNPTPYRPSKKEEECRDYAKFGTCRRGDTCPFSHGRPNPKKAAPVTDANSQPEYNPQPSGSRPTQLGAKSQGGGKHDKRNRKGSQHRSPSVQSARSGSDSKRHACYAYSLGRCTRGNECRYAHRALTEEEKKRRDARSRSPANSRSPSASSGGKPKLCPHFLKGQCRNGQSCPMRHDPVKKTSAVAIPRLAIPARDTHDLDSATPRYRPPVADE